MAQKRRRFSPEFKKKVALEALCEQDTVQKIASRYKVHLNQVGAWKRQAVEGLSGVFEVGGKRGEDHEEAIRDLHAKIGELTVERDFFCAVWGDEPHGKAVGGGRGGRTEPGPAVRARRRKPLVAVLQAGGGECGEPGADARDRRGAHQVSVLRGPADALAPAPRWRGGGREPRARTAGGPGWMGSRPWSPAT